MEYGFKSTKPARNASYFGYTNEQFKELVLLLCAGQQDNKIFTYKSKF